MNIIQKCIVENLSDGITTPMSFLLPMVLFGGHLQGKTLLIGSVGGAVSMAYAFKSMESTEGTWTEWLMAFVCSALGGVIPTLCFMWLFEPYAAITAGVFILGGILHLTAETR